MKSSRNLGSTKPLGPCACGCGNTVYQSRQDYVPKFIPGHYQSMQRGKFRNPNPTSTTTSRMHARQIHLVRLCEMAHIKHCRGRIDIHHKDKNPLNNETTNLMAVCAAHHRLLDSGRLKETDTKMPEFKLRGTKRIYSHHKTTKRKLGVWLSKTEESELRERAKKDNQTLSDYIKTKCLN